jgi:hypothetical protein
MAEESVAADRLQALIAEHRAMDRSVVVIFVATIPGQSVSIESDPIGRSIRATPLLLSVVRPQHTARMTKL